MGKKYDTKSSEMIARISPKGVYDMTDLRKLIWWSKKREALIAIVEADKRLQNILRPEVTGEGVGKRYKIRGENIIKFFKTYGPGIELVK